MFEENIWLCWILREAQANTDWTQSSGVVLRGTKSATLLWQFQGSLPCSAQSSWKGKGHGEFSYEIPARLSCANCGCFEGSLF